MRYRPYNQYRSPMYEGDGENAGPGRQYGQTYGSPDNASHNNYYDQGGYSPPRDREYDYYNRPYRFRFRPWVDRGDGGRPPYEGENTERYRNEYTPRNDFWNTRYRFGYRPDYNNRPGPDRYAQPPKNKNEASLEYGGYENGLLGTTYMKMKQDQKFLALHLAAAKQSMENLTELRNLEMLKLGRAYLQKTKSVDKLKRLQALGLPGHITRLS